MSMRVNQTPGSVIMIGQRSNLSYDGQMLPGSLVAEGVVTPVNFEKTGGTYTCRASMVAIERFAGQGRVWLPLMKGSAKTGKFFNADYTLSDTISDATIGSVMFVCGGNFAEVLLNIMPRSITETVMPPEEAVTANTRAISLEDLSLEGDN